MSRANGDKSRYNRNRRSKIARRVRMRALRAESQTDKAASAPEAATNE